MLEGIHHAAIICSDYEQSKRFYSEILGFKIVAENYRKERDSWKLDLALPDGTQLELFSFTDRPPRPSYPEALGLRHLAFRVENLDKAISYLKACGIQAEPVRVDEYTRKRFTFFSDPDELPLEIYES